LPRLLVGDDGEPLEIDDWSSGELIVVWWKEIAARSPSEYVIPSVNTSIGNIAVDESSLKDIC
jgi:hypothetical protein